MKYLLLSTFILLSVFIACRKESSFITEGGAKIAFTTDTLRFDTVFTEIGSATRYFKVKNPHSQSIKISKVNLGTRTKAVFNLNIDGISGRSFENIEILPKDSIYVFVEVTVNPNAPLSSSPFVMSEDLIFETNGNRQVVILEAWGQNANYIPNRRANGQISAYDLQGGEMVWNDSKPYVIYGLTIIANGTLRIPAGTKVYTHGGIAFRDSFAYRDGRLVINTDAKMIVEGTLDRPVVFSSDRLEPEFKDEPEQWWGIYIVAGSKGNVMSHTHIKNSLLGVIADSASTLNMNNCRIYNTSSSGLIALHATVNAENCLFYNTGGNSVQLEFGGSYDFKYCTMSSIGSKEAALSANNLRCYQRSNDGLSCLLAKFYPLSIKATNCIFYGGQEDQISLFDASKDIKDNFNLNFKNCIVRVKDLLKADNTPDFLTNKCTDCINATGNAKLFRRPNDQDYRLDTLSIAEMKAFPIPNITSDILGRGRDAQKPDIGCFEYYPK
jgi:hypothetical protein